ncbi:MAG: hypothetical protein AAF772_16585, partial [Acidobacteriota bacterium]
MVHTPSSAALPAENPASTADDPRRLRDDLQRSLQARGLGGGLATGRQLAGRQHAGRQNAAATPTRTAADAGAVARSAWPQATASAAPLFDASTTRDGRSDWLSVGVPAVDALLGGGLHRRRTIELIGGRSSGRFGLVLAALASVTARGHAAALIDLAGGLDADRAAALGVELPRLLWLRPHDPVQALRAAELVLPA